jgi:hypothetical protein
LKTLTESRPGAGDLVTESQARSVQGRHAGVRLQDCGRRRRSVPSRVTGRVTGRQRCCSTQLYRGAAALASEDPASSHPDRLFCRREKPHQAASRGRRYPDRCLEHRSPMIADSKVSGTEARPPLPRRARPAVIRSVRRGRNLGPRAPDQLALRSRASASFCCHAVLVANPFEC